MNARPIVEVAALTALPWRSISPLFAPMPNPGERQDLVVHPPGHAAFGRLVQQDPDRPVSRLAEFGGELVDIEPDVLPHHFRVHLLRVPAHISGGSIRVLPRIGHRVADRVGDRGQRLGPQGPLRPRSRRAGSAARSSASHHSPRSASWCRPVVPEVNRASWITRPASYRAVAHGRHDLGERQHLDAGRRDAARRPTAGTAGRRWTARWARRPSRRPGLGRRPRRGSAPAGRSPGRARRRRAAARSASSSQGRAA